MVGAGGKGNEAAGSALVASFSPSLSLPSSSHIDTFMKDDFIKRNDLEARTEWERLFLEILSYGTDYTLPFLHNSQGETNDYAVASSSSKRTISSATTITGSNKKQLSVKIRCQRAVSFLQDTVHKADMARWSAKKKQHQEGSAAVASSSSNKSQRDQDHVDVLKDNNNNIVLEMVDVARLGLVDALWVVGQFVCPSIVSSTDNDVSSSTKVEEHQQSSGDHHGSTFNAFRHIIHGLLGKLHNTTSGQQQQQSSPGILPLSLLQMALDPYVLDKVDVGSTTYDIFSRRYVKFQTNVLYRQKRFNLLAEESEGYAKVITLLCSLPLTLSSSSSSSSSSNGKKGGHIGGKIAGLSQNSSSSVKAIDATSIFCLQQLRAYIGTFDLDPNRVLAVLLDVLEEELKWTLLEYKKSISSVRGSIEQEGEAKRSNVTLDILLQLILHFKISAIPHLLGFLLTQYTKKITTENKKMSGATTNEDREPANRKKNRDNNDVAENGPINVAPESFFDMVAFLLAHDVVDAKSLFPYFAPDALKLSGEKDRTATIALEKLELWTKKRQMEVANEINEWGVVSLSSTISSTSKKKKTDQKESNDTDIVEDGQEDEDDDRTDQDEDAWKIECEECPLFYLMDACLSFGGWGPFMKLVSFCRFPPKLAGSNETVEMAATSTSSGQLPRRRKPLDVDLILLFPKIGKSICELINGMVFHSYYYKDIDLPRKLEFHHHEEQGVTTSVMLLSLKIGLIPPPARFDSYSRSNSCPIDHHVLQTVFDPVMMLASSHHAILDYTMWCNLCQIIHSCLSGKYGNSQEKENAIKESFSTSSAYHTTKLACKTSKLLLQWYILPALSLYPAELSDTTGSSNSKHTKSRELLWSILDLLPYPERYSCYDAWAIGPQSCVAAQPSSKKSMTTSAGASGIELRLERRALSKSALNGNGCERTDKRLWIVQREVIDGKTTRSVLKRLAKETIHVQGEQFAKVSNTSPIVSFKILIHQMQAYDNMIELMVNSFKQCSNLARDVLVWCIIRNLEGSTKKSALSDATSTQMASSIEAFVGELFKVFPKIEIRGILDLIVFRLMYSDNDDAITPTTLSGLGIVRSLLTDAGGLEAMGGEGSLVSKQQLEGRAGSLLLRRETVSFGVIDRVSPTASRLLRKVLLWGKEEDSNDCSSNTNNNSSNIGIALLIRLSQINLLLQLDDKSKWKNVMLLSRVYDSTHFVWMLLLDFLASPREWDTNDERLMVRENYSNNLPSFDELQSDFGIEHIEFEKKEQEEANVMFDDDINDGKDEGVTSESEVGDGLPKALTTFLPDEVLPNDGSNISSALYKTFWSLELYDLVVPIDRYVAEINRLTKEEERLLKVKQQKVAPSEKHPFDRKQQEEYKRIKSTIQRLKLDETKQSNHCTFIKTKVFDLQKGVFFPSTTTTRHEGSGMDLTTTNKHSIHDRMKHFLTNCIIPRTMCSPFDALYCYKFVMRLYVMNVPNFHLFTFLDYLFNSVKGILMTVTEEEAQNIAIILEEFWNILVDWRFGNNSSSLYEKKVSKKPGAVLHNERVDFEKFQEIYARWQKNLFDAFVGCLDATTANNNKSGAAAVSLRLRAALSILNRMVRIFPTNPIFGDILCDKMKILQQRQDGGGDSSTSMKPIFNAYLAQLTKAMNDECWKEQTAEQRKERQKKEQAKINERKKKQVELQREMDKDIAKVDLELGNEGGGRGGERRGGGGGGGLSSLDRRGGGDHRHGGHGGGRPFSDRDRTGDHHYDYRDRDATRFTPRGGRDRDTSLFERERVRDRDISRGPSPAAGGNNSKSTATTSNSANINTRGGGPSWSAPPSSAADGGHSSIFSERGGGGGRWPPPKQQQNDKVDESGGGTTRSNRGGGYKRSSDPPLYDEPDISPTPAVTSSNKRTRTLAMDKRGGDRDTNTSLATGSTRGENHGGGGYSASTEGRRRYDHGHGSSSASWERKQGRKSR